MKTSRARRGLSVILAMILLAMFAPAAAQAAGTAYFNLSAGGGRPGLTVSISQGDPCPNLPEYSQYVSISFTDAAGVKTGFNNAIGVSPGGSWNNNRQLSIPTSAAQGIGMFDARCIYWGGSSEITSQEYAPRSYNVVGTPPQFTRTPGNVQPGETVTLTSVDACPSNRVQGAIYGQQVASNFDMMLDPSGAWSVDVPTSSENDAGEDRVPFPPGTYTIRAYCLDNATARTTQTYVDQQVVVGTSTPPAPDCRDVIFMAVAGSGQYFDGAANLSISPQLEHAYKGFRQVLPNDKKVKIRVINYPALPVETLTRQLKVKKYLDGKNAGVNRLRSEVAEARLGCPNRPIVLAGFSQGALVVQEFMIEHAASTTGADKQAITAAILLANPAQVANSQVINFGNAPLDAQGVCQYFAGGGCFKTMPFGDVPQVYRGRTTSVCKAYDIVCDTNHLADSTLPIPSAAFKEGVTVHASYTGDNEVKLAGKRAARQVMRRW